MLRLLLLALACAGGPTAAADPSPASPDAPTTAPAPSPEPTPTELPDPEAAMSWRVLPERIITIDEANTRTRPASVAFALDGEPVVSETAITLRGTLRNTASAPVEVVIFPTGYLDPLVLEFAPDAPVTRKPRPLGGPPAPPPRPPPPHLLEVPGEGALAFERSLQLVEWDYAPGTAVTVSWSFQFWDEPKPAGTFEVTLP